MDPHRFESMGPTVSCWVNIGFVVVGCCFFTTFSLLFSPAQWQAHVGCGDGPHWIGDNLVDVC